MPKYIQIANELRKQILAGEYGPNQQLPFEKDLCELFSVSKMTIKKALDILVNEGLIVKRRGHGTFVKYLNQEELDRFKISRQFMGTSALFGKEKVSSKVLNFSVETVAKEIRDNLNINEESFVYNIHRVRIIDGNPLVIEQTYMPIDIIPGLKLENVKGSIYEYIESSLNASIQSVHRKIKVRQANEFEIRELELNQYDPIATVEQTAYLDNGELFEYSISTHRYDEFQVEFVLTKD